MPAAPHLFALHQSASHGPHSLLLEPPIMLMCGAGLPSGFTHVGLTPLQPLHPDALTFASNSKMAAGHQRGPNRVSPPLDCELLQRDLGHRRLESQHYSLPDAWLATNMCCCCFLKINKHADGEPPLRCPVFCLVLSLHAPWLLLLWRVSLRTLMLDEWLYS